MGDVMKESVFSLAEAKFTTGDFNHMVLQNVNKAQLKVRSKKDNVAGITKHSNHYMCHFKKGGWKKKPALVIKLIVNPHI